ncbi:DUF4024 domain-containing protein [Bacillus sp. NPDC077411]
MGFMQKNELLLTHS